MKRDVNSTTPQTREKKDKDSEKQAVVIEVSLINKKTGEKISSFIKAKNLNYYLTNRRAIKLEGMQIICNKTGKTGQELIKSGYSTIEMKIVGKK